jgi:hypothetical protein
VKETQRANFWRMLSAPDSLALIDPMNLLGRAHRIHEDFSAISKTPRFRILLVVVDAVGINTMCVQVR